MILGAGAEIISPILQDKKEDVEDIYMMCNMLKESGQDITRQCAGHVHIGSEYLKSKEAYANLVEIWGNAEKILYIISNEKGTVPRRDVR